MPRFRELTPVQFQDLPEGCLFWTPHVEPGEIPTRMKQLSGPYEKALVKGQTLNAQAGYELIPAKEEDDLFAVGWIHGKGYDLKNSSDMVYILKKGATMMKKEGQESFTLIGYLEARIQNDEAFLREHQDQLNAGDAEQKEIYEYTQGKIDMCRQVMSYLEEIRQSPNVVEDVKGTTIVYIRKEQETVRSTA